MRMVTPWGKSLNVPRARMDINIRLDGRVERICKHGVGHPVGHIKAWKDWMGAHGCDGCCKAWNGEV